MVEAKAAYKHPAEGLQRAKDYATILGLPFAYATNGDTIIEFDFTTGQEGQFADFPTPQDLWARWGNKQHLTDPSAVERFLTPFDLTTGKIPHYYQRIAIDRLIQAVLRGKRRVLVTVATGTGKTDVAFQICRKLWSSRWNRRNDPHIISGGPQFPGGRSQTKPSPPSGTPGTRSRAVSRS